MTNSQSAQTRAQNGAAIRRQIKLPFKKSIEITVKSLKVRLMRNLITVVSLVLAVAFLNFMLVNNDLANGVLAGGGEAALERLAQAGFDVAEGAQRIGTSAKSRWLMVLSLLVCTVGIVNAQLMSVTERFREIGVMKCLGALDSMVLRLFLMEAFFQGLAGSAAGAVLGLIFAVLQGLLRFGHACINLGSMGDVLISFFIALGVGCGLSIMGVLYPAILAARMKPIKALSAEH
jgi:putative ABC transport system permease protein